MTIFTPNFGPIRACGVILAILALTFPITHAGDFTVTTYWYSVASLAGISILAYFFAVWHSRRVYGCLDDTIIGCLDDTIIRYLVLTTITVIISVALYVGGDNHEMISDFGFVALWREQRIFFCIWMGALWLIESCAWMTAIEAVKLSHSSWALKNPTRLGKSFTARLISH